jgi:hypothetical protein
MRIAGYRMALAQAGPRDRRRPAIQIEWNGAMLIERRV